MIALEKKHIFQESSGPTAIIPFLGRKVSCGLFGIGDDFVASYQQLDKRFVKNQASTFFFEAAGDSMAPTINPKDILIVDRGLDFSFGKVCIFSYEGQLVCKRALRVPEGIILRSDNSSYEDIVATGPESLSFWGVVTAKACDIN